MEHNLFKGIIDLLRPKWKGMLLAMICTALDALCELLFPLVIKYSLDNLSLGLSMVWHTCIFLVVLTLVNVVVRAGNLLVRPMILESIKREISRRVFRHCHEMGFDFLDEQQTGNLMLLADSCSDQIRTMIFQLSHILIDLAMGVIMVVVIYGKMNSKLLSATMIPFVLCITVQIVYVKIIDNKFGPIIKIKKEFYNFIEDHLNGLRTTISFNMNEDVISKFNGHTKATHDAHLEKWKTLFSRDAIMLVLEDAFYIVIMVYGAYLAVVGELTIAEVMLFYSYGYRLINPIDCLGGVIEYIQEGKQAYRKVEEFMNTETSIKNAAVAVTKESFNGKISFNNVSFGYNNDTTVLKDINLTIKPGEYVAFCGESGVGKSTIAGLIPRYYDVKEGSISIDGINVKDIDLGCLRRNIGVVSQDIYLFHGTVYDNISFAVPGASMEDVIEAAKLANAHEFISKLPNGYNSDIGEKGIKLSGGQKQRIALARLFLANPSILIFDEATSALDNESERLVQQSLERLVKGRTTIAIAHRLTTIQNADRIIVLTENGIEEQGTHKELLRFGGRYAKLARVK